MLSNLYLVNITPLIYKTEENQHTKAQTMLTLLEFAKRVRTQRQTYYYTIILLVGQSLVTTAQ